MVKTNIYSPFIFIVAVLSFGCSGMKESTRRDVHEGLTIYATDWKKNTFRPLEFATIQSEEHFVGKSKEIPQKLFALMDRIKTQDQQATPSLNFRVLVFLGADTLMVSKDCSVVLNSVVYKFECDEILEILEAVESKELLEKVSFPEEWYLQKD